MKPLPLLQSLIAALALSFAIGSQAQSLPATAASGDAPPGLTLSDAQEARVKALAAELRCLVCQNQTVADSTSMVARDMREQVRQQIAAGKTDAEVKHYMTERFGDFVLYKPPLKAATLALWFGPFIVLLAAGALLLRRLRRPPARPGALSPEEQARARALLGDDAPSDDKP